MAKKETKQSYKEGDAVSIKGTVVAVAEGGKITVAVADGEGREVYRLTLDKDHVAGG